MSQPTIVPLKPPTTAALDHDGQTDALSWSVYALSAVDARLILAQRVGVTLGSVYINSIGQQPDPNLVCQSIDTETKVPAPPGDVGEFIVTANYGYDSAESAEQGKKVKPGGPAVWTMERLVESVQYDVDIAHHPISNFCEEPIDPPPTRTKRRRVLVAKWIVVGSNQLAVDASIAPFLDTVNETPFRGAARGCLQVIDGIAIEQEGGSVFVTMKFLYAPPQKALDTGTKFITRALTSGTWTQLSAPIEGHARTAKHQGFRRRKTGSGAGTSSDTALEKYTWMVEQQLVSGVWQDKQPEVHVTVPIPLNELGQPESSSKTVVVWFDADYADFNLIPIP